MTADAQTILLQLQIQLVPMISEVRGDASHGSHSVVAPTAAELKL